MALEQAITDLTQAADGLTQEVAGKMGAIDAKTAQSQADVANYIAGARMEAPFVRVTPNQSLMAANGGAGIVPDGWSSDPACTWTPLFTLNVGSPQVDAIETAAISADTGLYFGWINFVARAYKCTASQLSAPIRIFNAMYTHGGAKSTFAAYMRLNAGSANLMNSTGSNVPLIADGKWRLVGLHNNYKYLQAWIDISSADVDIDIFLPAAIHGLFDLNKAENWWIFPRPSANGGVSYAE